PPPLQETAASRLPGIGGSRRTGPQAARYRTTATSDGGVPFRGAPVDPATTIPWRPVVRGRGNLPPRPGLRGDRCASAGVVPLAAFEESRRRAEDVRPHSPRSPP